MLSQHNELTICDVLSDPVIGAVMRADRVSPHDMKTMLCTLARERQRGHQISEARETPVAPHRRRGGPGF